MLSLYFRHESLTLTNHSEEEWFNDNRTMSKSVTIMANASYWPYECVSVDSVEVNERSATILIRRLLTMPAEEHDRLKEIGYVLILFSVWCIFPVVTFCMIESGLMREVLGKGKTENIIVFIYVVLLVVPIPFTMIICGVIYKDDCPAAEEISIYPIVMGSLISFFGVFFLIWFYQKVVKEKNIMEGSFAQYSLCLSIITGCVILGLFIAVTQGSVETEPIVRLPQGSRGLLPCKVTGQPLGIRWSKGRSILDKTVIVFVEFVSGQVGDRGGPGYEKGLYNITDDFSLVIHEVEFDSGGQYICEMADALSGQFFDGSTLLVVIVLPNEPYPTIDKCLLTNTSKQLGGRDCSLYNTQPSHTISCFVDGYSPDINITLYFRHSAQLLDNMDRREWSSDGNRTMGQLVTIMANVSFEPYECVAMGTDITERSASILIRQQPVEIIGEHTQLEIVLIFVSFYIACVIPVMAFYTIIATKHSQGSKILAGMRTTYFFTVPFVMIVIGVIYKDDCPAAALIPTYLITMGSVCIVFLFLAIKAAYHQLQPKDKWNRFRESRTAVVMGLVIIVLCFLILGLFIAGNVWIYGATWPNTTDPASPGYCSPVLYYFSFALTTLVFVVIVIRLIIGGFNYWKSMWRD